MKLATTEFSWVPILAHPSGRIKYYKGLEKV